jgi:drug/metabolite transporter (DMT)-like permease
MNGIQKSSKLGYLLALMGGIILSFDTVLIRAINLPPDQIAFWRSLSMSLPMLVMVVFSIFRRNGKINRRMICGKDIYVASFFYGLSSILFPVSAMTTSIANMLFIISTAPLWAAVFSWIVTREVVNRITVLAFIISLVGVIVVIFGSAQDLAISISFGDITALITAMSMAAAFVVGRVSQRDLSLTPSIGAVFSSVILYLCFHINLVLPLRTYGLILAEGAVIVFLALTLIAKSSHLIPAAHLSFFLLLETVFGPIWIGLVFGDMPETHTVIGGAIILSALIVNSLYSMRVLKHQSRNESQMTSML